MSKLKIIEQVLREYMPMASHEATSEISKRIADALAEKLTRRPTSLEQDNPIHH